MTDPRSRFLVPVAAVWLSALEIVRMIHPRLRYRVIVGVLWLSTLVIVLSIFVLAPPTPGPGAASTEAHETPTPAAPDTPRTMLDPASFEVTLWTAPAPQASAPPTRVNQRPPPPPPIRLQLIAILTDSAVEPPAYQAAIYDPDADELSVVDAGEQIGRITVSAISDRAVHLTVDGHQQQLALDRNARIGGRR